MDVFEDKSDEYDVGDWKKWNERFDQLAKEDQALIELKAQLVEAVYVEDYGRASTVRDTIEAALNVDPAMKIQRGMLKALKTEDYGLAAKYRDAGAGLLGWWHGVDVTELLKSQQNNQKVSDDKTFVWVMSGGKLVLRKTNSNPLEENNNNNGILNEEEEEETENNDKKEETAATSTTKFPRGTMVHVTVKRGRLVGTSYTAHELADANNRSPLETFEMNASKGINDENDGTKISVKDKLFGAPFFELHVREAYDETAKEMKFVTQPARLHYVEAFKKIPIVSVSDEEDKKNGWINGDFGGLKIEIKREIVDDDGKMTTKTIGSFGGDAGYEIDTLKKTLAAREERIKKLKAELKLNLDLLRKEMKLLGEVSDPATEKAQSERIKMTQEIKKEIIARNEDKLIQLDEADLDYVIDTIFDAFGPECDQPFTKEEMVEILEDYNGIEGIVPSGLDSGSMNPLNDELHRSELFASLIGDDKPNIVDSEGAFDSQVISMEDLYGDPALYDRMRIRAECKRISPSSFLLSSEAVPDVDSLLNMPEKCDPPPNDEESTTNIKRAIKGSTIRFERIPDHVATQSSKDPFDRLYVGAFGPHGAEIMRVVRGRYGDELGEDSNCVTGIKLTGDANVPAGAASFRAKIDDKHKLPKLNDNGLQAYPEELGVLARYKGQGRVAKPGFKDASWTDGELLVLDGKAGPLTGNTELGFVWAVPNERRLLILFTGLKLPTDLMEGGTSNDKISIVAASR